MMCFCGILFSITDARPAAAAEKLEGEPVKSVLHEQRRSSIAAAIVTMGLGAALLCWPVRSAEILCLLLGAAILITGVIYIVGWISRRREGFPLPFLLPGVILCALGLWMLASPESVVKLVQYICAAVLVFHGVVDVQSAAALARRRCTRWWLDMALGVLTIGLGVVVLLNPLGTTGALMMLVGASLIFDGASDLYLIWRLSRAFRH